MSWTLTSGGTTQSFAAWKITGLRRTRSSQAQDRVTFAIDGAAYDGTAPFAADAEIIITKDASTWFRGRVVSVRRDASGRSESIVYEVAGPWWYLERLVYQQTWTVYGVGEVHQSHCFLNAQADGSAWNTRLQLDDALDWCSDAAAAQYGAAPFQWTASDLPAISIPSDEVRDITCAEVVRKQLRWIPDAVTWWDYSTNPPTFKCKRRADLTGTDVAIEAPLSVVSLVPRYDLQVPSVVLKFEQINTVDGASYRSVTRQNYPGGATGEEFGALCATIDLLGFSAAYASAYLRTSALPSDSSGWWNWLKGKHPWLSSSRVVLTSVDSVSRQKVGDPFASVLDNELLDGQIASWISASSQHETVTIVVTYDTKNAGETVVVDSKTETFTVNIVTTDATTGTYTQLAEFVSGESVPSGLAQAIYDALHTLEWEGRLVLTEAEVGGAVAIGQKVNLTGGRSEWTTMAAVVQQVDEDVDSGTTTIDLGPPQHLGPRDMVELLRVNRNRVVLTSRNAREGGVISAGAIALGSATPAENATKGVTERTQFRVRSGTNEISLLAATPRVSIGRGSGTANIDLDVSSDGKLTVAAGTTSGKFVLDSADTDGLIIELQEVAICVNGEEKRMLILASEPYDP